MSVRCEECNYENLPQHRFCGMCGAKLPSPRRVESQVAERRERAEAQAFSRPSLLGLAEEDPTEAERITYLLEDEPTGHRGQLAVLLLLLVAMAGAGWYWRANVRAWISKEGRNPATAQSVAPITAPPAAVPAAPAPTTEASSATPQPAEPRPANETATQSADTTPSATAPTNSSAAPQAAPPVTDAAKREPEPQEEPAPDTTTPAKPALKPAVADVNQRPVIRNASADAMETEGENYLYGNGVQPNCALAGKSLLAAAAHSSTKAQTVLGTMYATGHCVTRDVPVAYRWFAKALHQEPGNARIQQDLNVLWQQMTPEEREIAEKTEP